MMMKKKRNDDDDDDITDKNLKIAKNKKVNHSFCITFLLLQILSMKKSTTRKIINISWMFTKKDNFLSNKSFIDITVCD